MREILFRGEYTETGDWVKGFYVRLHDDKGNESHRIYPGYAETDCGDYYPDFYEVDPATVGQFTGLTDKNGKKIFEGDIVRGRHWTSYNDKKPEDFHLWRVDWSEKSGLITFVDSPTTKAIMSIHDFADFGEVEVIGNIHDNPELLGGAEDG